MMLMVVPKKLILQKLRTIALLGLLCGVIGVPSVHSAGDLDIALNIAWNAATKIVTPGDPTIAIVTLPALAGAVLMEWRCLPRAAQEKFESPLKYGLHLFKYFFTDWNHEDFIEKIRHYPYFAAALPLVGAVIAKDAIGWPLVKAIPHIPFSKGLFASIGFGTPPARLADEIKTIDDVKLCTLQLCDRFPDDPMGLLNGAITPAMKLVIAGARKISGGISELLTMKLSCKDHPTLPYLYQGMHCTEYDVSRFSEEMREKVFQVRSSDPKPSTWIRTVNRSGKNFLDFVRNRRYTGILEALIEVIDEDKIPLKSNELEVFMWAVLESKQSRLLESLLKRPEAADLCLLSNERGETMLMQAPDAEIAQIFLNHKINPLAYDKQGKSALVHAIKKGNFDVGRLLMQRAPDLINAPDRQGRSPLYYALRSGEISLINDLIAAGADVRVSINNKGVLPSLTKRCEEWNWYWRSAFKNVYAKLSPAEREKQLKQSLEVLMSRSRLSDERKHILEGLLAMGASPHQLMGNMPLLQWLVQKNKIIVRRRTPAAKIDQSPNDYEDLINVVIEKSDPQKRAHDGALVFEDFMGRVQPLDDREIWSAQRLLAVKAYLPQQRDRIKQWAQQKGYTQIYYAV